MFQRVESRLVPLSLEVIFDAEPSVPNSKYISVNHVVCHETENTILKVFTDPKLLSDPAFWKDFRLLLRI